MTNKTSDFWNNIQIGKANECWTWTGYLNLDGYGRYNFGGKRVLVHRLAYELEIGTIPDGLCIDHLCRNRACCNPKHMEPVDNITNILRGDGWTAKNARKTHCPEGHAYSGKNLWTDKDGRRHCRICLTNIQRLYRKNKRQRISP